MTPFPLSWPAHQRRTLPGMHRDCRFKPVSYGRANREVQAEVNRLGGANALLTSNVPVRRDGAPHDDGDPNDPGVALYFQMDRRPMVIACDSYPRAWMNAKAIAKTIEAMRAIDRFGSTQMFEQALGGFAQLPAARPTEPPWWETLGLQHGATLAQVEEQHTRLALAHHPDVGGDAEHMARINRARDVARERLAGR